MTDEQIKQNAEAYARRVAESHIIEKRPAYFAAFNAFISGAHSRDEEIEELKGKIERQKAIITVDGLNEKALWKELDQLRNPWIKPSEQMPVDGDDIVYLLYEGKAGRMKYHSTYEKWLRESVTHWMKVTLK